MPMSVRAFMLCTVSALLLSSAGCSSKTKALTLPIGEKVQVGKLSYQVIDASWQPEVAGLKQPPKNRVLQIHVTVTNTGAEEIAVPMLRLHDAAGNEVSEIMEVEGNTRWLGMIRRMQPALTEDGMIYFDVPVGTYKLEVVDNSMADNEQIAFIEIPASLAPPPSLPADRKGA